MMSTAIAKQMHLPSMLSPRSRHGACRRCLVYYECNACIVQNTICIMHADPSCGKLLEQVMEDVAKLLAIF